MKGLFRHPLKNAPRSRRKIAYLLRHPVVVRRRSPTPPCSRRCSARVSDPAVLATGGLLPPSRQLTTDESEISSCNFDEDLVKPRSTIDPSPNPNPNHMLRTKLISPRLGSIVHFPGFSSLPGTLSCHRPQVFFRPAPQSHRPSFRPPLAAHSRRPAASSAHPARPLSFFLPCRSVSSVVNSSIVTLSFATRRAQHPPAAPTDPSTNTIYKKP